MSEEPGADPVSEPEPDELGLDAAWALLNAKPGELEARLAQGDEAAAALRRSHLEALAMLAWSLPAEQPSAGLRGRLLSHLQGDETQLVSMLPRLGPPPDVPALRAPAGNPAVGGLLDPARPASSARARLAPPPVLPRVPARSSWALPLAAVLALCTLGLLGWNASLWHQLDGARGDVAQLQRQQRWMVAQLARSRQDAPEMEAMRDKLEAMDTQLALVSSPRSLVCPLKSSPGAPVADAAGVLFVADDHQHWYLRAQKLSPLPGDRVYQLWFLVGDKPVRAGTITLSGQDAVLASPSMPTGTSAAMVTVEPAGVSGERPSGPVVLYGHHIAPMV